MVIRAVYVKTFLILLLVLIAAFAVWKFFFAPDEISRIRARMEETAKVLSIGGEKKFLENAEDFSQLESVLDKQISVSAEPEWKGGTYERKEIVRRYISGRVFLAFVSISLHNVDIHLDENAHAHASLTVYAEGKTRRGEKFREARDVAVQLRKNKLNEWIFTSFEIQNVIRMPDQK